MTIREVLTLDVLQDAEPVVLAGQQGLDREVRWVHSSEIYEIAPLLSGGELLLTTGLGLHSVDSQTRRRYIRDLAASGVAGVALELGRSFENAPPELVDEAQRLGFPLIALGAVVPFIRISEVVNTVLVDYSSRGIRRRESTTRALNEALMGGTAPDALLKLAARLIGAPLVLYSDSGAEVSRAVPDNARSDLDSYPQAAEVPVQFGGAPTGRLVAYGELTLPLDELVATMEYLAIALSVALISSQARPTSRDHQAATLLVELVDAAVISESEASIRARMAGLDLTTAGRIVGAAVQLNDDANSPRASRLIDTVAQLLGFTALRARVGESFLVAFAVSRTQGDPVGAVTRAFEEAISRHSMTGVQVGIGHAAHGPNFFAELGNSLRSARAVVGLVAVKPVKGRQSSVASSRDLALELLLSRATTAAERDSLVETTIGPLARWDAAHGSELVQTLGTYLQNGCSPTRTAGALHVGRQSLYQRIERIESLLGLRITEPRVHAALLIATVAHGLRNVQ